LHHLGIARRFHHEPRWCGLSAAFEERTNESPQASTGSRDKFRLGIPGIVRRTAEMATKATEYKAKRGLNDFTARSGEKAIANRIKKAMRTTIESG
jgi:hypothetical protein